MLQAYNFLARFPRVMELAGFFPISLTTTTLRTEYPSATLLEPMPETAQNPTEPENKCYEAQEECHKGDLNSSALRQACVEVFPQKWVEDERIHAIENQCNGHIENEQPPTAS